MDKNPVNHNNSLHITSLIDQLDLESSHMMYEMIEAHVNETFNSHGIGAFQLTLTRMLDAGRNKNIAYGLAMLDAIICDSMQQVEDDLKMQEQVAQEQLKALRTPTLVLIKG